MKGILGKLKTRGGFLSKIKFQRVVTGMFDTYPKHIVFYEESKGNIFENQEIHNWKFEKTRNFTKSYEYFL